MALDPEFLGILVCPATRKPLREATEGELASVNERIRTGAVHSRGGALLQEPLQAGLVPEAGDVIYPVQEGIPVLLVSEAIELGSASPAGDRASPGGDAADGAPAD